MCRFCIVLLLIFGAAHAIAQYKSNKYLDDVLYSILPNEVRFSNVDPAELRPFSSVTNDSLAFLDVTVKFNYSNGLMIGMLKAKRAGDCSQLRRIDRNTTISCMIIFNDIKILYGGSIKYGKLPTKSIQGFANLTATYVQVDITASNGKSSFLKSVLFTNIGDMKARFTGLGFLNDQLKKLADKQFVVNAKNEFLNVLNLNWVPGMMRAVSRIPLPTP